MKKTISCAILFVLFAAFASAACYDSDDGPKNLATPARYLGIDGFVTEGNTTYYDTCVSRKGGSELDNGLWLREYYCGNNGDVDYEDYFCPSYYYVECLKVHKAAACDDYSGPSDYNETTVTNTTNTTNTSTNSANNQASTSNASAVSVNCGDGKVNHGEDCDPPGKECYTKRFLQGVCDFSCICDSSLTPNLFKRLNASMHKEEDQANAITATVTFEVNESKEVKQEAEVSKNDTSSMITGAASDPLSNLIKDARKPSEDFSDSIGIKITSAITNVVMSFWAVLMNVIGG